MPTIENTSVNRRPSGPGVVFQGVVLTLIVTLASLSLTVRQPPPPTIAEFAPQALEQIKQAPEQQGSQFGSAEGTGGGGLGSEGVGGPARNTAADDDETIDVPRVRRCVGSPPRQIEDPQSPPCVPYWEGDNGGATARGVTRDEIRVAVPSYYDGESLGGVSAIAAFFNKRFEFYGRKIRLIDTHTDACCSPDGQRAAAINADEVHKVFATIPRVEDGGYYYLLETSRRKIVSAGFKTQFSSKQLADRRPYLWSYPMAHDRLFANIGEWACARLAGGNAVKAGSDYQQMLRKFGLITGGESPDVPPDASPLKAQLRTCGESVAAEFDLTNNQGPQFLLNAVQTMKDEQVTSVFCVCQNHILQPLANTATQQSYFPEWLISTYELNDFNTTVNKVAAEHREHALGITINSRQIPPSDEPAWWAIKEIIPDYDNSKLSSEGMYFYNALYRTLLLLASGMQMAGPNLTPETFEQGLQRAAFPNPEHPNMAAKVGFAGGSHSMTIDAAEYWLSTTAPGPYTEVTQAPAGSVCYVDGGRRYRTGSWPTGRKEFSGACDSGAR